MGTRVVRVGLVVVALLAVVLAGCGQPGKPADRFPRRVPVGVDGPHPLRFFNVWPLWYANGDVPNPIALTFDDGPGDWTPQILDVLQGRNVPATFFELGINIAGREWMVQRILGQGDRIGTHTWDHADLNRVGFDQMVWEVESTRNVLNGFMGNDPVKCLRPPYGNSNDTLLNLESANSLAEARWDVDPADWQTPPPQVIADRVVGAAHPGAVVLLHDGGGNRANTVAALPQIIDRLRSQGYNFVSIC